MKLVRELLKVYLIFAAVFFIGRLLFFIIFYERFAEIPFFEALFTFIYGIRMDTIVISVILVIPTIILTLSPKLFSKFISKLLNIYILAFLVFAIFIECASFPFFLQYDLKPNYLFLEYLEYPKEVSSLMFKDYKLDLFLASVLILITIKIFTKYKFLNFESVFEQNYLSREPLANSNPTK